MKTAKKILIVEDEKDISRILTNYLNISGYETVCADNGADCLRHLRSWQPDYIILDIMLPDIDGIELCQQIRERVQTPILILSARGSDTDKVLGLGLGADDYMTKPFSLSELAARIGAYFRRYDSMAKQSTASSDRELLQFGALTIDKRAYSVSLNGQEVSLSAKEFELLHYLAYHRNQVFTKSQLLDAVWGYESIGDDNTVTVYIRRIREKIEADPSNPALLKTVWGVGYKFSSNT
ncbi:response regulator [Cohnella sp. CFH 77786]|uniref:response regulator transcription factor n=1 Tax=Cohnella sp. CFH 77786 TaxID=2662265 RepID=UPI001C60958F|nr:response regulator transcription factor [Cohnella sp. CFH 77786]MBW5447745.1 response regulator [Cohnella sp. CFH 77786]